MRPVTPRGVQMKLRRMTIPIQSEMDIAKAILEARRAGSELGFGAPEQSRISTAASELARNIVKYAGTGQIRINQIEHNARKGIEVIAEDNGPGIADINLAMKDHFSTSGTLGLGLPGVRRLMDEFNIESEKGKGTR